MSLALPYSFPKAPSEEPDPNLPREVQVSNNLEIGRQWTKVSPVAVSEPYVKVYSNSNTPESIVIPVNDPLDDILAASHREILEYSLDLPYSQTKTHDVPKIPQKNAAPQLLIRKRSRKVLELVEQRLLDNTTNIPVFSGMKTPTRNSIRIPSSTKKPKAGFRESTPTSDSKNLLQRKLSLHRADLKAFDIDDADKSIYDPLACHADNIMRMAMDSTMLGSFCNNSFSSNFSNLAEDSILGGKYHDILSESERSMTEMGHKAPSSLLAKQRAQKIEISAEELENAVNGSLR